MVLKKAQENKTLIESLLRGSVKEILCDGVALYRGWRRCSPKA